ncbi:MAG: MBL fold metallo-hydrolase [Clostridia bacterium]|nr:MBL fold metallo-hydrolase [Clostridia bacterium]
MLQAYTLFSGSSGNSIYIKDGKTEVLVDAGKSASLIEKALTSLGSSLNNISAIFITHEHSDHTSGLEIISKKYHIPIHITSPSAKRACYQGSFASQCAHPHEVRYEASVGSLKLRSFEIPHDSNQNVGYIIENEQGERLGIATDMGHVTDEIKTALCGCKTAIIESNHDKFLLVAGPYPEFLKHRILADTGHLANEDSVELSLFLAENGAQRITLAHLSKENNAPEIAFGAHREALDKRGFSEIELNVARPAEITIVK